MTEYNSKVIQRSHHLFLRHSKPGRQQSRRHQGAYFSTETGKWWVCSGKLVRYMDETRENIDYIRHLDIAQQRVLGQAVESIVCPDTLGLVHA
jgi:hypothetical protein